MKFSLTTEDIKFAIASAFFFCVVYPLRKIVVPILKILLDQAYFLLACLTGWAVIYLYDYDTKRIVTELVTKISLQDSWFISWLFTPTFFDSQYTCPILLAIYIVLACSFANVGFAIFRTIRIALSVIPDVILLILFVYYSIAGKKELATICSTGRDERRAKMFVYLLGGVLIIGIVAFVVITSKSSIDTTLISTQALLSVQFPNATISDYANATAFIPDIPYQNITRFIP